MGLLKIVSRNEVTVQLQVEDELSAVVAVERHRQVIEMPPWRRDAISVTDADVNVTTRRDFSFWTAVEQPRLDDLVRRKLFGWNPVTPDSTAGSEPGPEHFIVQEENQKDREEF